MYVGCMDSYGRFMGWMGATLRPGWPEPEVKWRISGVGVDKGDRTYT